MQRSLLVGLLVRCRSNDHRTEGGHSRDLEHSCINSLQWALDSRPTYMHTPLSLSLSLSLSTWQLHALPLALFHWMCITNSRFCYLNKHILTMGVNINYHAAAFMAWHVRKWKSPPKRSTKKYLPLLSQPVFRLVPPGLHTLHWTRRPSPHMYIIYLLCRYIQYIDRGRV